MVLTNSEQTRGDVLRHFGLDPTRVHNIYLGCDIGWRPPYGKERRASQSWLGLTPERRIAVFVGGLGYDERKGFDTLFAAWQELCGQASWDVDLLVAGSGLTQRHWEAKAEAAGLAGRIRFLGHTDRVHELLAAADVLVSPVRYEPYGLNVQEAILRGVPAIVSRCAGIVEQFPHNVEGLLLQDPRNAAELADRFRTWRADPVGWCERFNKVAGALRRYSWAEMAARIVDLAESQAEPRSPERTTHEFSSP
jgi:glycosyltransferase involved in cell wall biosynthesis